MNNITIEMLPDKSLNIKWENTVYDAFGLPLGYSIPTRRALSPHNLNDRSFVENCGGELLQFVNFVWSNIPYPNANP